MANVAMQYQKSQLLVWGAAMMMHLLVWGGMFSSAFQPVILKISKQSHLNMA
jgi:hypothetical protein